MKGRGEEKKNVKEMDEGNERKGKRKRGMIKRNGWRQLKEVVMKKLSLMAL